MNNKISKELLEYFHGDELAASTWLNKYALKDDNGNLIEDTPDDMHRRLAKLFSSVEEKYPLLTSLKLVSTEFLPVGYTESKQYYKTSTYYKTRSKLDYDKIYNLFKNFKYVIPGGSIMAGLGSKSLISLSNCFVIKGPEDSYSDIMRVRTEQVQLIKRRGGVGYDLSGIRPRGAIVHNAAVTATGAASFMDVCSDITNEVSQEGRRGALMLTMSINHPDIEEFVTKKQDLTKVTGANISIKVTSEFMNSIHQDSDDTYILRYPVNLDPINIKAKDMEYNKLYEITNIYGDKEYYKKIHSNQLWNKIIHCAWNTAEPGIIFENAMHLGAPDGNYPDYKMVSTNPCFTGDMRLLTKSGYKTFEELVNTEFDIVTGPSAHCIGTVVESGVKNTFKIKLTNDAVIKCTRDHKFMTRERGLLEADKLKGKHLIPYVSMPDFTGDQFAALGFIQGDGNLSRLKDIKQKGVEVNIGLKDDSVFNLFPTINKVEGKHVYYTTNYTKLLREEQFSFEVLPVRVLPGTIKYWSSSSITAFLHGLWSANGTVSGNKISLRSTSKQMILELQELLKDKFNIETKITVDKAHLQEFKNGTYMCKDGYDLNIEKFDSIITFANTISFVHPYKRKALLELIYRKTPKVTGVVHGERTKVYDFKVFNMEHLGYVEGYQCHNCGEIGMGAYDSCRLIHLNLSSFVDNPYTQDANLNITALYQTAYETTRLADDLIELELQAVRNLKKKCSDSNDEAEQKLWWKFERRAVGGRRIGVGFTGLADCLAQLCLPYYSPNTVEKIMDTIYKGELDSTIDMAIERGKFPDYYSKFENITWLTTISLKYGTEIIDRMKEFGRRNISFSTVAPTGTVSIMARCSSGIEPVFQPYYIRKRKCTEPTDRVDFVDKVGEKFTDFLVVHPGLEEFAKVRKDLCDKPKMEDFTLKDWEKIFKESPYYKNIAPDVDPSDRVALQSIIQDDITHSISSTINLPKTVTESTINSIYLKAYKYGCKGITVYRDECRNNILSSIKAEKPNDIVYSSAPKRPKDLPADCYLVKIKGEQFIVMVGLYNERPYEVFAFRPLKSVNFPIHKGVITKKGKMHYSYKSKELEIGNLQLATDNIEERAATLYASMLLRHGVDIKYIIKTAKKVDDNITSFSSAMCRILSKYMNKEEVKGEVCPNCGSKLVREEGCIKCTNCGYSKCG